MKEWDFGTRVYIKTEHKGISRIYSGTSRYIGKKFDKNLVGADYYTGIPAPGMDDLLAIVAHFNADLLGTEYSYIVGTEIPQYKPVEGPDRYMVFFDDGDKRWIKSDRLKAE